MNTRSSFLRKPTAITIEEDCKNLTKGQSKTRRIATPILSGRFSKTSSHFVEPKRSNLTADISRNELLLKTLFLKLKDMSLNRHVNYRLERDIRHVLSRLHSSFVPRVITWQDKNGLDIVHICILSNHTDLLETLFIKEFIPISHQPMTCPYAHLSTVLNRPECLKIVLTNRPNDHFKLVDSFSGKLPPCVLSVSTTADRDDKNMEMKMTCLLANVYTYSKTTADEMNIPKDIIEQCTQQQILFNKKNKSHTKGGADYNPILHKLSKEGHAGQTPRKKLHSADSSFSDIVYHSDLHLTPKKGIDLVEIPLAENHRITCNLTRHSDIDFGPSCIAGVGKKVSVSFRTGGMMNLPDLKGCTDSLTSNVSNVSLGSKKQVAERYEKDRQARNSSLQNDKNAKKMSAKGDHSRVAKMSVLGAANQNQNASTVKISVVESFYNETPLSIAYKKGFFRCVKIIMDIIVAKKYGENKESQLVTATTAESPVAVMVLCEGGTDLQFDDFQDAVLLALRLNLAECCNVLLSSRRNAEFRKKLLGGDNLLHVMYTRSMAEASRGITRCLNEMTCMLISNKESVVVSKPGQYPLYSLIVCAFNDKSTTDPSQYFDSFKRLLEAGSDHLHKERGSQEVEQLGRGRFTSVFDCVFSCAQTSVFELDNPDMVQELVKRFCFEFYDHYTEVRAFGSQSLVLFSYMALAVKFDIDIDVLKVLLRLGFNPTHKYQGYYAVNYYFHILFPYLEKYEVENFADFYKSEVEKLMYLCHRMPLAAIKDAMLVFLDNQMTGLSCQAICVARYFCHLMGQIVTSPRSLRDTCALQVWYANCYRIKMLVNQLPVKHSIRQRIMP